MVFKVFLLCSLWLSQQPCKAGMHFVMSMMLIIRLIKLVLGSIRYYLVVVYFPRISYSFNFSLKIIFMQVLELVLENFVYPWYRYVLFITPISLV